VILIQTVNDGRLKIGSDTHSTRCQFSCVQGTNPDWLWRTNCAELRLLPHDHGVAPGELIISNHCKKGGIMIDDDAWLGFGVIVLDGVRIGMP